MKRSDLLAGSLFAAVGVAAVVGAIALRVGTPLHPQPGFFPFLGGCGLTVLAVTLIIQAWFGWSTGGEKFGAIGGPAILVVGMAVYVGVLDPVGYVPTTTVLAVIILRVLRVTSWRALGVSSVALSVGTYILFRHVLGIDLPVGVLTFLG